MRTDDQCEDRWCWWSRQYEYPWVLANLLPGSTHNTGCGGCHPVHCDFARALEDCGQAVHSDISLEQAVPGAVVYDLKQPWGGVPFDNVLCISVLEHLEGAGEILGNLWQQTRGVLLVTFDYPCDSLTEIEGWCGRSLERQPPLLSSENCRMPYTMCGTWNVGALKCVQ
ncbi:MAG: hypothetical protein V1755_06730 [Chloroflexota bacterium]